MTAAIYTRYSTDRQRETSLADQAHVCQARANALGLSIFSTYGDDGIGVSCVCPMGVETPLLQPWWASALPKRRRPPALRKWRLTVPVLLTTAG